ncbi:MAG: sulfite dehydrogenase (cytochrome) subunit [Verrucomicrobiota bacterium]|jgi:mono/diheme cytochrome c family protein
MLHSQKQFLPGFFILLVALSGSAADSRLALPSETTRLKPGAGLEVVNANCLLCHSADYISTQPPLTAAQWRASVVKMQAKYGAPISTNHIESMVSYLVANYGSAPTNSGMKMK